MFLEVSRKLTNEHEMIRGKHIIYSHGRVHSAHSSSSYTNNFLGIKTKKKLFELLKLN